MLHSIRITNEHGDATGACLLADIMRLRLGPVEHVSAVKVYRVEGLSPEDAHRFARSLASVGQSYAIDGPHGHLMSDDWLSEQVIEVGYQPGVMNPEAGSLLKMGKDLGLPLIAADSSTEYHFTGSELRGSHVRYIAERLLVNKTVGRLIEKAPETLLITGERGTISTIALRSLGDADLMVLSKDKLFLNLDEMRAVQQCFAQLGRDPTDGELETVAQWWSEHCCHKTFGAHIETPAGVKPPLFQRLKDVSREHQKGVISAFVDNAGVSRFYDGWGICAKVETHNSPSAAEPYGGAATGTGGVIRDIFGLKGAKVLLSTDMFCFAPPSLPYALLPKGCLHPDYLLRRVVQGVGDYGNRMGIPTANGSVHFHEDFRAKPTVIVGAYGIIPERFAQKGSAQEGDLAVVLGGRTGRDGIHGATFSSGEMTERTATVNANAVQIGNAIEEKRTGDAIVEIRDAELIRAITDCGAGGFSSAVGELGKETGVLLRLEKAPLKYSGLQPWEILLSESQERMVMVIAPEHLERMHTICAKWNVEATVIGEFTGTKRFVVTYFDETLVDLSYDFLVDGVPKRVLKADWKPERFPEPPEERRMQPLLESWKRVLGHLNVCSKERIVRGYDHSVQGTNALPPYGGACHDGPNDAVVLRPLPDKPYGMIVAHGLNPILNRIDPYAGSLWAGVEALANFTAVGGNPSHGEAWLVDNFIWPFPDQQELGALDRSVDACCALTEAFGLPYISGKDSLSSTYRNGDMVIKIPPVVNISVMGRIPDVRETASADFKRAGSNIVLVGVIDHEGLGGSVYYDTLGFVGNRLPDLMLATLSNRMLALRRLIAEKRVLAVHDVSEGGIAVSLAEMCFGGNLGAWISLSKIAEGMPDGIFFSETAGSFLLEVDTSELEHVLCSFPSGVARLIGKVVDAPILSVHSHDGDGILCRASIDELRDAWKQPMREVFHAA